MRGRNLFGYSPYTDEIIDGFCRNSIRSGLGIMRIFDALNDVDNVKSTVKYVKQYGGIAPSGDGRLGLIVREPAGVVACVLPWNFPLMMVGWKLGPALAEGNSVILKPASVTSLSTLKLAEFAAEAGIPEGVFNVITGPGSSVGEALGLHPGVDVVSFTGSTEVGRRFLEYAARSNLKRIVLELGGKSPFVVLDDVADYAAVAAQAVSRATGQDPARCRMAVAVAGSPTRGIEFLKSAERQDARRQMVRAIDSLIAADEADVLSRAKSLIVAVKAPLAEVKSTQEKVLEQNADYLSRGALKQLEDRNKRELNARERSGIMEALASARTLMRDVLLTLQDEAADVVNEDVRDTIGRLAAATNVAGATQALEAFATAERNIARNVTPQLAIEVMLFDIRKALKCR